MFNIYEKFASDNCGGGNESNCHSVEKMFFLFFFRNSKLTALIYSTALTLSY